MAVLRTAVVVLRALLGSRSSLVLEDLALRQQVVGLPRVGGLHHRYERCEKSQRGSVKRSWFATESVYAANCFSETVEAT